MGFLSSDRMSYFAVPFALAFIGLLHSAPAQPEPSPRPQEESARLMQLAQRLQLEFVEAELLADKLAGVDDSPTAAGEARRLAAIYVKQLEQSRQVDAARERLTDLIRRFPSIDEPPLQLALLYADFSVIESRARQGFRDPTIAESLAEKCRQLSGQIDALRSKLSKTQPTDSDPKIQMTPSQERDSVRFEGYANQLDYLDAWTSYYSGVIAMDPAIRDQQWQRADNHFRQILQLQVTMDLTHLQADWLDLSSGFYSRTVLGLALSEQALGNESAADTCFHLLVPGGLSGDDSRPLVLQRMQGYLFARRLDRMREWLNQKYQSGDASQLPEAEVLAYAVEVAYQIGRNETQWQGEVERLNELIIRILLDENQLVSIDQLIAQGVVAPDQLRDEFLRAYLSGRSAFQTGERTGRPEDFARALAAFDRVASSTNRPLTLNQQVQLRYLRGWCLLRLDRLDEAALEFRQTERLAGPLDSSIASQAAWMEIQCHMQANLDPHAIQPLSQAIERLQQRYPNSPWAAQAEYQQAKLQARADPGEQSLAPLLAIPAGDPQWPAAQLEIARVRYRQWQDARDRSPAETDTVRQRFQAFMDFAQAFFERHEGDADSRGQVCLWVTDAAINSSPVRLHEARLWLDRARDCLADATLPRWEDELKWQEFQLANAAGDRDTADQLAAWIIDHHVESSIRTRVLIHVAQRHEQAVAAADQADRRSTLESAVAFYRRLLTEWGDSPEQLRKSSNAFAALVHLAEWEAELGQTKDADLHFDLLRQAAPQNLQVMLGAANAKTQLEAWDQALPLWRSILRGVRAGSEEWLLAKYQLVQCLRHTADANETRSIVEQVFVLAPSMGDGWRAKFEELRRELSTTERHD